jgi:hypothetical protein
MDECVIIHPQTIFDLFNYTGLVRYLHSLHNKTTFICLQKFKGFFEMHYKDLNEFHIMYVNDDKINNYFTIVMKHFKKCPNQYFFGPTDKLRINNKYTNHYNNKIKQGTFDPYDLYEYDSNIKLDYFHLNRNKHIEMKLLKSIMMMANTVYTVLTSNKNVDPKYLRINTMNITLDQMFKLDNICDSLSIIEYANHIFLTHDSDFTPFILMIDLKHEILKDKRVFIFCDETYDDSLIPSYWKKLNY